MSGCFDSAFVVEQFGLGSGVVSLWYSNGCNANWGQFWDPNNPGNADRVCIHSQSPAPNDSCGYGTGGTTEVLTLLVDGSYLAQACGDVNFAGTWPCTGWH
jgi:hypothetical protein